MGEQLIRLDGGVLLEVDVPGGQPELIAGGVVRTVNSSLDGIRPILAHACRPIIEAWKDLNQDLNVETAEIELGLSFESEGNVYIAKAKAGATITVRLTLAPKSRSHAT